MADFSEYDIMIIITDAFSCSTVICVNDDMF